MLRKPANVPAQTDPANTSKRRNRPSDHDDDGSPHLLRTMMMVDDDNGDPSNLSSQANVVNIAFGDYSGGILGQEADDRVVREGIDTIHAKVPMMIVNFDDDDHDDDCDDGDDDDICII